MKIVHFLKSYPHESGPSHVVRGLSRAFVTAGHQVEVWSYTSGQESSAVQLKVFPKNRLHRFVPPPQLRRFILSGEAEYDLVVLHGMFCPYNIELARWLNYVKIPYMLCPHDPYHPDLLKKHWIRKTLYRPLERYVLNHSIGVHVISESHAVYLKKFGCRKPAITIENGFAPETIPVLNHRQISLNHPARGITLLFLGRIARYHKGLDLLLRAFSKLIESPDNLHISLTIMGPNWGDLAQLQQLASDLAITQHVNFLEPDFTRHPAEIIRGYDLLIAPSRYDGFPYTVLEAMLSETPVIVSSEAGIAAHVQKARCGLIVPPQVHCITEAIQNMMGRQSEWGCMGERGKDYAFKYLTWKTIAAKAERSYRKLLYGKE